MAGKTEFVYLQTVAHTGTYFMLAFLLDHPEMGGVILHHARRLGPKWRGTEAIGGGKTIPTGLIPGKKNILREHVGASWDEGGNLIPYPAAGRISALLAAHNHPVCMLRDPLLCMTSFLHHIATDNMGKAATRIVADWRCYVYVTNYITYFRGAPVYFPIDILKTVPERAQALRNVEWAMGLKQEGLAGEYAAEWPIYAAPGKSTITDGAEPQQYIRAKRAYADGDIDWLKKHLPGGIEGLQKHESEIRPLFEEQGYTNLLWWS